MRAFHGPKAIIQPTEKSYFPKQVSPPTSAGGLSSGDRTVSSPLSPPQKPEAVVLESRRRDGYI